MNGWWNFLTVLAIIAAALAATQLPKWRQAWRNARGVIELTEAEGDRDAIAAAVTCDACTDPSGLGACICTLFCGHRFCRGRRVSARWTEDDMTVLAGDLTSIKREGQW